MSQFSLATYFPSLKKKGALICTGDLVKPSQGTIRTASPPAITVASCIFPSTLRMSTFSPKFRRMPSRAVNRIFF